MNDPENYRYTDQHMWAKTQEDGSVRVGITRYAQDMLGDIVFVEAPKPGNKLSAGQPCGIVESVKTASDLHAPIDGEVIAINPSLQTSPEMIGDAPYDAWIFTLKPSKPESVSALLDVSSYLALIS